MARCDTLVRHPCCHVQFTLQHCLLCLLMPRHSPARRSLRHSHLSIPLSVFHNCHYYHYSDSPLATYLNPCYGSLPRIVLDSLTTCSRIHYTPITVSLKDSVLTLGPAYLAEASTTTLLPSHVIFPCCTCVGIPLGYCSAFSNWFIIH